MFDFIKTNKFVRRCALFVTGAITGAFGHGFFTQNNDDATDQVIIVEESTANTAKATIEVTTEPEATSPEEVAETPVAIPIEG